jgi:hypothetical protein
MMKFTILLRAVSLTLGLLFGSQAYAAGTLNVALSQQFSFVGCSTAANVCGTPLIGGLLYFYQVGTASTRQDSFQDTALTVVNPWPLQLDTSGRVPMFYLADGSVHVRLTDAGGVVIFDYPSMLVVGPSGGGGGGAGVDATAIASTGDIKFRMTSESLQSWTKLNGQKIGAPGSPGADLTGNNYLALYSYLWVNCPQSHCPVTGGRGVSAAFDFCSPPTGGCATQKSLQLPDWRGRGPMGLDDMGVARANIIPDANIKSGGGDTALTPGAWGGEANHTQLEMELAAHFHSGYSISPSSYTPAGTVTANDNRTWTGNTVNGGTATIGSSGVSSGVAANQAQTIIVSGSFAPTFSGTVQTFSINIPSDGNSTPFNVLSPFILGTWYIRQ